MDNKNNGNQSKPSTSYWMRKRTKKDCNDSPTPKESTSKQSSSLSSSVTPVTNSEILEKYSIEKLDGRKTKKVLKLVDNSSIEVHYSEESTVTVPRPVPDSAQSEDSDEIRVDSSVESSADKTVKQHQPPTTIETTAQIQLQDSTVSYLVVVLDKYFYYF